MAACLLDNAAVNACLIANVEPQDFYGDFHRQMYQAMLNLCEEGMEVTIPTVCYEMRQLGAKEEFLELDVTEMVGRYYTAVGVEAHIKIVKRCAAQRDIIAEASRIATGALQGGDPVSTASDGIRGLSALAQKAGGGFARIGSHQLLTFESGVMTNIPVIDRYMRGLLPGKLTVLAAHSRAGKSVMAGQIALAVARQNTPTAVFSLEMNGGEYDTRMAHALSGVQENMAGTYSADEAQSLRVAHRELLNYPLYFKNKPRISLGEIEAHCRIMKSEGVFLVVVDYLQLMAFKGAERQDLELGEATSTFKGLAGEMGMHFLVLSQMNRGAAAEMRAHDSAKAECLLDSGSKFPLPFIESLKGSSAIEQDADHVIFLTRHPDCIGHTEVVLAKNRGGAEGRGVMIQDFSRKRFHRLTQEEILFAAKGFNQAQLTDTSKYQALMEDSNWC